MTKARGVWLAVALLSIGCGSSGRGGGVGGASGGADAATGGGGHGGGLESETDDARCTNGLDDDGDGYVDCFDFDCTASPEVSACPKGAEETDAFCSDHIDNDGDGYLDCYDFDCMKADAVSVCPKGPERSNVACSDGFDNDGDGYLDCGDFDCTSTASVSVCEKSREDTDAECSDGIDNDQNGFSDCQDYACLSPTVSVCTLRPENSDSVCNDGTDNDRDGFVDCDDWDCSRNDQVGVCAGACTQISFKNANDCSRCLQSDCCSEMTACVQEASCLDCWNQRGTSCDTNAAYLAATGCQATTCETACTAADPCPGVRFTSPSACTDCLEQSCCSESTSCATDAACLDCWQGGGTSCDSNSNWAALGECRAGSCYSACGGGGSTGGSGGGGGSCQAGDCKPLSECSAFGCITCYFSCSGDSCRLTSCSDPF